VADPFWSLRNEILASEQIRNDWLKYKLFASAVLGGVAFGLNSDVPARPVVLLIPFVCLYSDIICSHNQIRIQIISLFLKMSDDPISEWEKFASQHERHFRLESLALSTSTQLISILVLGDGVLNLLMSDTPSETDFLTGLAGIACGAVGLFASLLTVGMVRRMQREIGGNSQEQRLSQ